MDEFGSNLKITRPGVHKCRIQSQTNTYRQKPFNFEVLLASMTVLSCTLKLDRDQAELLKERKEDASTQGITASGSGGGLS